LSVEHAGAAFAFVPPIESILLRAVILAGLVAPWVWLVAIDRLLNRKR
jgi:hypothetical protein